MEGKTCPVFETGPVCLQARVGPKIRINPKE